MIQAACRETKDRLSEDLKKSFSWNIYKFCGQGLQVHDGDLNDAISNCTKENSLDISMTDFFKPLNFTDARNSSGNLSWIQDASPAMEKDLHIGDSRYVFTDDLDKEELSLAIHEKIVGSIINVFFKKVDSYRYVEQQAQYQSPNDSEVPSYLNEFITHLRKVK